MFSHLNSLCFVKIREPPRTKFMLRLWLAFIKLLSVYLQNHIQLFMISIISSSLFLSPITLYSFLLTSAFAVLVFAKYSAYGYALDRLVTVSYMHYCTSTSVLSTSSSSRGLTTFVGISHLEGGFTLRCLQRLSRPGLATLPCSW